MSRELVNKPLPGDLPAGVKSLPSILLPYQASLLATTAKYPVVFCEKSRRIGITWGIGADASLLAATKKSDGGMDVYYMGYNLEMAREFINVCGDWSKIYNQACGDIEDCVFEDVDEHGDSKEIKAFRIQYASGFKILALPSAPRSLRGMQGCAIIDEAAFHDDLEEVIKAAMAFLMWGGKVWVFSTHDGVDNPFNQQIQGIKEKRKGFTKHKLVTITFQDAISDGLYERICLVNGSEPTEEGKQEFIDDIYAFYGEGADEELDVIPRKSGGVYFPSQLVEPCMDDAPVVDLELADDFFTKPKHEKERFIQDWCVENLKPLLDKLDTTLVHCFGSDYARKGDLAIFAPIAIEKNTRRRVPFQLNMRNVPFSQQEYILYYIIDRLPRLGMGMMDATGNGESIAEKMQERYGVHRIFAVKINVGWYEDALPKYKGAMQDGYISIPRDADNLQDHRTAQVVGGVPQIPRLKGKDGGQRHGDSLVAFAGAYWATLQDCVDYGYTPAFPEDQNIHNSKLTMRPDHSDDIGAHRSRNFGNNRGAW